MAFTAILFMQLYQNRFLVSIIQPIDKQLPQSIEDIADLVEKGKAKCLFGTFVRVFFGGTMTLWFTNPHSFALSRLHLHTADGREFGRCDEE